MKVLFGENNVYWVGMIGMVVDKIVYGYVKVYECDKEVQFCGVEEDWLVSGVIGVKWMIGQYLVGIIIVFDDMEIYDFMLVQYLVDD